MVSLRSAIHLSPLFRFLEPSVIKPDDPLVTIGASAGASPGKHCRSTQGLVDEVLEEDRSQKPGDGELDLVNMALIHHSDRGSQYVSI